MLKLISLNLKSSHKKLMLLCLSVLLAGCLRVGNDYTPPQADIPNTWRTSGVTGNTKGEDHQDWWKRFQDPQLTALINTAAQKNKSLQRSAQQIKKYEALLGVAQSGYFPQIDLSAQVQRSKISQETKMGGSTQNPYQWDHQGFINLSYEIDFWGRVQRQEESALATLLAEKASQKIVLLTVVTAVAQRYFTLRALDGSLAISQELLALSREHEHLIQRRFQEGFSSSLDVQEAVASTAQAAQDVSRLQHQIAQEEHALCVLLGRNPSPIERGKSLEQIHLPEIKIQALPSHLLKQRPDIERAEQELRARNADVGVAEAQFFPQINLLAFLGVESLHSSTLLTKRAFSGGFGGGLTAPLFHGGRIQQEVRAAEAEHQEALLAYLETLQVAFQETEDALVGSQKTLSSYQQQLKIQSAQKKNYHLQQMRHQQGVTSRVELLKAKMLWLQTRQQSLEARLKAFLEQLKLYKALGGGWSHFVIPAATGI
ncbi:MAG: efflux transporter outer membrane subunit [Alphaproteobacteria bacterium]